MKILFSIKWRDSSTSLILKEYNHMLMSLGIRTPFQVSICYRRQQRNFPGTHQVCLSQHCPSVLLRWSGFWIYKAQQRQNDRTVTATTHTSRNFSSCGLKGSDATPKGFMLNEFFKRQERKWELAVCCWGFKVHTILCNKVVDAGIEGKIKPSELCSLLHGFISSSWRTDFPPGLHLVRNSTAIVSV